MNTRQCGYLSSDEFRTIIASAIDGFLLVDTTGSILEANDSYCQMVGYSRDELLKMNISSFDTIESQEDVAGRIEKLIQAGSIRFETKHKRKDGTLINIEVRPDHTPSNGSTFLFFCKDIFIQAGSIRFETKHKRKDGTLIDLEVSANYSPSNGGIIFSFFRDISSQTRTRKIIAARLRLMEYSLTHSYKELLRKTLDEVEALTGSCIGFYHFLDSDQQTLSIQEWSTRTANAFCKTGGEGLKYNISQAGVWADCIRERHAVIHNKYSLLPHRKGMPEGHPEVLRELVVPVFRNEKIVAVLGVGNKASDYNQGDVDAVTLLADLAWCVAEQKLYDKAFLQSEERYRNIVENQSEFVDRYLPGGILTFANQSLISFAGVPEKELLGKSFYPFIFEADREEVIRQIESICKEKPIAETESRVILPDGRIRWNRWTHTGFFDECGEIVEYQSVGRDITERKQVEEALHNSEELLKASQKIAHLGSWSLDLVENHLTWSDEVYWIFGLKPQEFGATYEAFLDYVHPEDRSLVANAYSASLRDGREGYEIDHRIVRKATGEVRFVHEKCTHIRSEGGQIIRSNGIVHDITERKMGEKELQESKDLLAEIIELSPISMAIVGMDGAIEHINRRALETFGYYPADIPNMEQWWIQAYPDESYRAEVIAQWMSLVGKAIAEKSEIERREYRVTCKDGTVRTTLIFGIPVSGKVFVMFDDITDRKRAEEERLVLERQLLQAQKMESLGVLAGGIAHDFNNILTSIVGNTELALMSLNPDSPVLHNLKRIEKSAVRATDLAKQMLAYSGKGKFVVKTIDLNRLVQEMGHILDVSISKKAILCYNLAQSLPTIEVDATQIRQVVMNLVINASEAIGERSGYINITTGCMDCDKNYLNNAAHDKNIKAGSYVYLEIADTGCGMDKETLAKVFDPFFTTKFTGRGLGMAAVQGIVRSHKGFIRYHSEPGKGTTFKVFLPASGKMILDLSDQSQKDNWRGEGKVLLVDDEETVRDIGKEMLQGLGFTVITANDGNEAIEIFKAIPDIALIILDLTMPKMDGEECFQELIRLSPDVKVIISSGFSEQEVSQKFAGRGMAGFIQKPYKISELKAAIQRIQMPIPSYKE